MEEFAPTFNESLPTGWIRTKVQPLAPSLGLHTPAFLERKQSAINQWVHAEWTSVDQPSHWTGLNPALLYVLATYQKVLVEMGVGGKAFDRRFDHNRQAFERILQHLLTVGEADASHLPTVMMHFPCWWQGWYRLCTEERRVKSPSNGICDDGCGEAHLFRFPFGGGEESTCSIAALEVAIRYLESSEFSPPAYTRLHYQVIMRRVVAK